MGDAIRAAFADATEVAEEPRPLIRDGASPEPFPVDPLGGLRGPAEAIQSMTQAPFAICAQSVLGAITLAVQPHADVELPTGATRPLSLFLLTIAGSGERKSAVDGLALKPVREYEEELRARHETDRVSHAADLEIWKAKQSRALNDLKKAKEDFAAEADLRALGSEPEPPLLPMMLCPDPTFEGYCRLTATGLPSIGLFSDEGGSFIGGFGMSADHRLKTAAALSSLWDGEPVRRVRAGDGAFILPGRRLAMHLMAQPEVANQLLGDDMLASQGLLSRLLTVAPESAAGTRFWKPARSEERLVLDAYQTRLAVILRAAPKLRDGCRNALDPRPLPLSTSAKAMWIGFLDFIEADLGVDGRFRAIAGLANKAPEHAGRIAAVLTLWRDLFASEIGAEEMAQGIELVQHYLGEAVRLGEEARIAPELALARRVLTWLQTRWTEPVVHPAAIYNRAPVRAVRDRKTALRIIRILEDHGWLIPLEGGAEVEGKRRKEAWRIHGRNMA